MYPGTPAARDITGKLVVQDALTLHIAKPIQAWHDQCCGTHKECNQTLSRCGAINADYAPLPSRCIKVSYIDSLQQYGFQLCDTTGQFGRYIILSHRWAPETFACRTTRANYLQRTGTGSTWDQNPTRLFVETCMLAHRLGIPFVWIDSLCIIQDDARDWGREAVKMAGYYQHAWITVSATTTNPATGGLFSDIATENLPRVSRLPYRDRQGVRRGYFYVQCTDDAELNRVYQQHVKHSELLTRGWVYQEWLLSPRTVAFTPAGVIMVCSASPPQSAVGDLVRNRKSTQEQQWDSAERESPGDLVNIAFKNSISPNMSSPDAIFESWRRAVTAYSGLALTHLEADRLVALSGVASEFGQALGRHTRRWDDNTSQIGEEGALLTELTPARGSVSDQNPAAPYVCGLWLDNIVRGLQWEPTQPETPRQRARGLPTWSWASLASVSTNSEGAAVLGGMRVEWAAAHEPREDVCRAVEAVAIPVDEELRPDFDADHVNSIFSTSTGPAEYPAEPEQYGNAHRFIALALTGVLLPVHLQASYFETSREADAAATLTAHDRPDLSRECWRSVARPQAPRVITGWALLEDPGLCSRDPGDGPRLYNDDVYALVLGRLTKVRGGWGYGSLLGYNTAFEVLFVKQVAGRPRYNPCFERVGVGRLFGPDVDVDFRNSLETRLWLM